MNIFHIFNISSKKGKIFFKYNMISIILFSILYWIADYMLTYYPKISKTLFFGEYTQKNPVNPYYYWLWHSLVTQTTVGYSGITTQTGIPVTYLNLHSNLYKVCNFAQLFSIIIITTLSM